MGYSYKKFFQEIYQEQGQEFSFGGQDKEDVQDWQREFRSAIKRTLGLDRLTKLGELCLPESVALLAERKEEGYLCRKYVMETLPEVFMPFYMLIPDGISKDNPGAAVITIPAHGANKNTVCGIWETEEERRIVEETPLACYGKEFAKRGYVVFCPDPPGYGERVEKLPMEDAAYLKKKERGSLVCSCKDLAETAEALGLSFAALEIHDLRKLLDFACGCAEVESREGIAQIACAGFSGGGQYTMWLAAIDERIRLAVVSGYVHGYYDSMLECHLCPCNYAPNLWKLGDISDVCSLIAPRPLFVENGMEDVENGPDGIEGPLKQVQKIQKTYEKFGAADKLYHFTPRGVHQWYGGCYDFVKRNL